MSIHLRIYRYIFWIGYLGVLITAFIPVAGNFSRIKIGPDAFKIRLDFLLHFAAYSLICMYYLFGIKMHLNLFDRSSMLKFVILILLLGTITEIVQLWLPERAFNVFDLVSNVGGVIVGSGVVGMAQRRNSSFAKASEDKRHNGVMA